MPRTEVRAVPRQFPDRDAASTPPQTSGTELPNHTFSSTHETIHHASKHPEPPKEALVIKAQSGPQLHPQPATARGSTSPKLQPVSSAQSPWGSVFCVHGFIFLPEDINWGKPIISHHDSPSLPACYCPHTEGSGVLHICQTARSFLGTTSTLSACCGSHLNSAP